MQTSPFRIEGVERLLKRIKASGGSCKFAHGVFHRGCLDHGSVGCERTVEDIERALLRDGIVEGADDFRIVDLSVGTVFRKGFAGDGEGVSVEFGHE